MSNHLIFSSNKLFDNNAVGKDEDFGDGWQELAGSSNHRRFFTYTSHRVGIIQLDVRQRLNTWTSHATTTQHTLLIISNMLDTNIIYY